MEAAEVTEPAVSSSNMSEQYYNESLEQAASYNARLSAERRLRLPFLDQQTGLAQNHSNLWMPYRYRLPGKTAGQIYSYPAKRWKKKKRSVPLSDLKLVGATEAENVDSADVHAISAVENPALKNDTDSKDTIINEDTSYHGSKDKWYVDDYDALSDPPDAGEIDDMNSDSSDFGEIYEKKRKKKTKAKTPGRGKSRGRGGRKSERHKEEPLDDKDKPYGCEMCGARYKTRPGLTYHLTHFHNHWDDEEEAPAAPSPKHTPQSSQNNDPLSRSTWRSSRTGNSNNSKSAGGKANPNNYCDFCLGDETENKKTGDKEELVSCADCGRSGHPSCLQFTANMIISVKKYPWQCIECKSCGLCGTSDNDEQLLFCDDCDRGYHMYCLKPPLSEPPEGSWSCHLCIEEFYGGKKPDSMQ